MTWRAHGGWRRGMFLALCGHGSFGRASCMSAGQNWGSTVCKCLCWYPRVIIYRPQRHRKLLFLCSQIRWAPFWLLFEAEQEVMLFRKFKVLKRSFLLVILSFCKTSMPLLSGAFWLNFPGRQTFAFYIVYI